MKVSDAMVKAARGKLPADIEESFAGADYAEGFNGAMALVREELASALEAALTASDNGGAGAVGVFSCGRCPVSVESAWQPPDCPECGDQCELDASAKPAHAVVTAPTNPEEIGRKSVGGFVCTGDQIRCHDGNGCECELNGLLPVVPAVAGAGDLAKIRDALQSARDYGSASWDEWLIEKADDALASSGAGGGEVLSDRQKARRRTR